MDDERRSAGRPRRRGAVREADRVRDEEQRRDASASAPGRARRRGELARRGRSRSPRPPPTTSTTGTPACNRPTGVPDAVEFIDVHKAFGRNKILRGLNMGLPEGKISMILGPSGTGKSVCIKHMVGLLYPDDGDVARPRRVGPEHARRRALRDAQEVRRPVPGRRAVRLDEPASTTSPSRCASTRTRARTRSCDIVNRRLAEVGLGGRRRQDAQRALGRHAQARRLRARARARPRHRALRRARLRPGPGPHRAAVRADPGDPRGERRRLRRDHARHHDRAPRGRVHRGAVEGAHRRVGPGRGAVQLRQRVRAPVPLRASPRARWAWSDAAAPTARTLRPPSSRTEPQPDGVRHRKARA